MSLYQFTPLEPWEDGCPYEKHGVVCKIENPNCERCGWNPAEKARRLAEREKQRKEESR